MLEMRDIGNLREKCRAAERTALATVAGCRVTSVFLAAGVFIFQAISAGDRTYPSGASAWLLVSGAWAAEQRVDMLAQAAPLVGGDCAGGLGFLSVAALLAAAICYLALVFLGRCSTCDLRETLKGNQPISLWWLALFGLGVAAGALATLLTALGCRLL